MIVTILLDLMPNIHINRPNVSNVNNIEER